MATTTVKFELGVSTVTVNGPSGSSDVKALPQWVTAQTQAGSLYSYRGSNQYYEHWSITLDQLTSLQWKTLKNFFFFTCVGPNVEFTYTHTDGVEYQVRFVNTDLTATRNGPNFFRTQITLQIQDFANGVI